ncbi:hypothetical protein GCM10022403_006770 [Streptomyces coacervatus]|uniref:Secreted protein n=1 Tax=Streptomyces coacervatus TaxID=647381 RepID=A0ABP7GZL4_9ACTN|nr:hypothetical protein [Streptomyces coacervatus]MDF2272665.1 hypothetical protein [Streptomyces coacervatus]
MNLVRKHRTRRATTAGVTLLLAAVLGTAGASASNAETAAPQTQQIASSILGSDYKITLTALRSSQDQYAASVQLKVYTHDSGTWKESDRVTVGDVDGWFWYPLTGSHAVCQFTTASTELAPVDVSLTITPSIGCSQPAHYVVKQGRVYAG